jgi:hypothetical protein
MGKGSARTSGTRDEYDATHGASANNTTANDEEDGFTVSVVSKNNAALDAPTPPDVVGANKKKQKPCSATPPPASFDAPPQKTLLPHPSFSEGGQDDKGGKSKSSSSDDDVHAGTDDLKEEEEEKEAKYDAAPDDTPRPPATLLLQYWMRSEVRSLAVVAPLLTRCFKPPPPPFPTSHLSLLCRKEQENLYPPRCIDNNSEVELTTRRATHFTLYFPLIFPPCPSPSVFCFPPAPLSSVQESTVRKREHIAAIDKRGGYWGMEDHIERTVFCHGDVVLERNMFPYETPRGISHWTLWWGCTS